MVIAGLSSSPMPPNGSSPGSGLGSSRSRSRSPLVPEPVEDDEEKQSDESDDSDDSFYPRRRGSSVKLNEAISREVRRALRKHKGKGENFWMELLEQILAQVRRVALLDNQSSQIAGESGLIYSFT